MKRFLACALALMTVFLLRYSALAETKDEILFRSIPWGSTYKDTMSILNETGIRWNSPEPYKSGKKELETGFTVSSIKVNGFSVAGNAVASVTLWFAYVLDAETNKPLSKQSALFIQAKYTFESESEKSGAMIEADLVDKLSSVYSNPDNNSSTSFANDYTHYWWWYGGADSKVTLYHNYTEPFFIVAMATDTLELTYTYGQMNNCINSFYDYLEKSEKKNTDGL